jgi:cytosine/creatinine deaminase
LASRGVEVILAEDEKCYELMQAFIKAHPEEWNEDIGEE